MVHFVLSLREREKRERRDNRGDEREGQGRKRKKNESEETEEIKTFPSTLTCYKENRSSSTVSQYQLDAPVTLSYTTPLPHRPPQVVVIGVDCCKVVKHIVKLLFG